MGAWPAPTRARPDPTARGASTGDIQGAPPLLVCPAAKPPRATGPRGGHAPESGGCCGNASPGTNAFAGMARSYKSSSRSHGSWCIDGGYTRGPPLVGKPCGHAPESGGCCGTASTGTIAFAAIGRSYRSRCPRKRLMLRKRIDRSNRFRGQTVEGNGSDTLACDNRSHIPLRRGG